MPMPDHASLMAAQTEITKSRDKGIKFCHIPVEKEKRQRWLALINRKDFDPLSDACICSVHFVGSMISHRLCSIYKVAI